MPVAAVQVDLDPKVAALLIGVAFSFVLRTQGDLKGLLNPATRMQQVNGLAKRLPSLLSLLGKGRRDLLLELGSLLRKGPDRYLTKALRELQGLAH